MESLTYLKNLKISPKKLRVYLHEIKKQKPAQALEHLFYTDSKPARFFYQAIKSAISNAKHALKIEESLLKFKLLTVEEGQKLKRFQPGGKGTMKPFKRRYSHIKIILVSEKKPEQKIIKEQDLKEIENVTVKQKKTQVIKKTVKNSKKTSNGAKG